MNQLMNLSPSPMGVPDLRTRQPKESAILEKPGPGTDSFENQLSEKISESSQRRKADVSPAPNESAQRATSKSAKNTPESSESSPGMVPEKKKSEPEFKETENQKGDAKKAMQKFMASIESEFGIPPERIVEAMAQLTPQQQLLPPEETADLVIGQLELEPLEEEKAMALYMGFLAEMPKMTPSAPPVLPEQNGASSSAMLAAPLVPLMDKRTKLNQSLDKMNESFFLKNQTPVTSPLNAKQVVSQYNELGPSANWQNASLANAQQIPGESIPMEPLGRAGYGPMSEKSNPNQVAQNQVAQQVKPSQEGVVPLTEGMQPMDEETRMELAGKLAALGISAGAMSENLQQEPINQKALAIESGIQNDMSVSGGMDSLALPKIPTGADSGMMQFGSSNGETGTGSESSTSGDPATSTNSAQGSEFFVRPEMTSQGGDRAAGRGSEPVQGAVLGGAATMTGRSDSPQNLQQVIHQTNYLIKKGGGEAKVKLYPEGMGQIDVRVLVKDGKVNVEMATETPETKKAIESSMSDLKSNLSDKSLSLESFKVNVASESSKSNNENLSDPKQQRAMLDQQGMNQRDPQRQFFSELRDEAMARREFSMTPDLKGYRSDRGPEPLTPAQTASRRYSSQGKGSGLDLVA